MTFQIANLDYTISAPDKNFAGRFELFSRYEDCPFLSHELPRSHRGGLSFSRTLRESISFARAKLQTFFEGAEVYDDLLSACREWLKTPMSHTQITSGFPLSFRTVDEPKN